MESHEASFEIDSRSDSRAASRILEEVFDAVREESRGGAAAEGADAPLGEFETLRDAAETPAPGKLTVIYDRYDEELED